MKFHIQMTLSAQNLHVTKVPLVSHLDPWQGDNILFAFHKSKSVFPIVGILDLKTSTTSLRIWSSECPDG